MTSDVVTNFQVGNGCIPVTQKPLCGANRLAAPGNTVTRYLSGTQLHDFISIIKISKLN